MGENADDQPTTLDLPQWLSGLQTVTWIVLRDDKMVLRAGPGSKPVAKRNAVAQAKTSDLNTADPDAWGGISVMWLSIRVHSYEKVLEAIECLLSRARAGRVCSLLVDQALPVDGWARLCLQEDESATGKRIVAARHSDVMRNPTLADPMFWRDDVLSVWPNLGDATATLSGSNAPRVGGMNRVRGLDYSATDAPLVQEAVAGLRDRMFRNPTDAARALAHKADGHGSEESKMKRLLGRIQSFSRGQP